MRSSSSVCATSVSLIALKPNKPVNARAEPFNNLINGYMILWNKISGPAR